MVENSNIKIVVLSKNEQVIGISIRWFLFKSMWLMWLQIYMLLIWYIRNKGSVHWNGRRGKSRKLSVNNVSISDLLNTVLRYSLYDPLYKTLTDMDFIGLQKLRQSFLVS